MKRRPRWASAAMARLLAGIALLASTASADRHRRLPAAATTDASLAQIRDTLQNLLRSVEDAGNELGDLLAKRQHWCDASLHNFTMEMDMADATLHHLSVDIREQEAAVEETEGTVLQLKADIALLQHTLNRTEEMLKVLNTSLLASHNGMRKQLQADESLLESLVQNKRQTLTLLEGEEEVILPMLAQLQKRLVEMRVQFAEWDESTSKEKDFTDALRDACSRNLERTQAQAAATASTMGPIATAMRALQQIGAHNSPGQNQLATEQPAIGFVQLGQEQAAAADEELFAIFGGRAEPAEPSLPAEPSRASELQEAMAQPVQPSRAGGRQEVAAQLGPQRSKIQSLLAELRGKHSDDQREWCSEEHASHQRLLTLAQASVGEMEAEIDVHSDSAAQLAEGLKRVQFRTAALQGAAQAVAAGASREQVLVATHRKGHALATRILEQALVVLADLTTSDELSSQAKQGMGRAMGALKLAKASLSEQAQALTAMKQEVAAAVQNVSGRAQEAAGILERERATLELALNSHTSQRDRCAESKRAYEAEVREANMYLQSLADGCKLNVFALEDRERKARIRALQDSQAVLEGRRPVRSRSAQGLRGSSTPVVREALPSMSPLERAAAEMGLAVSDS